jgi:hypothetical protein
MEWGPVRCLEPRFGISAGIVIATNAADQVLVRNDVGAQAWFDAKRVEAVGVVQPRKDGPGR